MSATIKISGADAIKRAFRELPGRLARKVIRQALRAGAKVVQAEAMADAPVDTGQVKKAIKVRAGKSRKKGLITMAVIIGKGDFKGDEFYGAFQNFGWKAGKRGSDSRRQVPGRHFMDRALAEKATEAQRIILDMIAAGIEREAAALGSGGGPGTSGGSSTAATPKAASSARRDPTTGRFVSRGQD